MKAKPLSLFTTYQPVSTGEFRIESRETNARDPGTGTIWRDGRARTY
jgi:hypothetical protein